MHQKPGCQTTLAELLLLPDARDGLNRKERIVMYCLMQTQKEFRDGNVPTITLYGRVLEHIDVSEAEFQHILAKMTGLTRNSDDPTRSWLKAFQFADSSIRLKLPVRRFIWKHCIIDDDSESGQQ